MLSRTKAFIALELILALLVIMFALHLFFDFSKQYHTLSINSKNLKDISRAQLALIQKQEISQTKLELKTQKLLCNAILLQNAKNSDFIFQSYEILECK